MLVNQLPHVSDYFVNRKPRGRYLELAAQHRTLVDKVVDEGEEQQRVDHNVVEDLNIFGVLDGVFVPLGLGLEQDSVEGSSEVVRNRIC